MGSLPIGLSASRAAAILGQSNWATPFSVWQDIMEKRQPGFNAARKYDYTPFEGNASTRWGSAFEDAVIKLAEEKYSGTEHPIIGREDAFSVKGMDYVTCHIDGFHSVPTSFILHEGKTTTSYGFSDKWGEPGSERIPVEYQLQTQHQMACTGADECIVSVLVFPKRPDEWEADGVEVFPEGSSYFMRKKIDEENYIGLGYPQNWADSLAQMGFFHQYTIPANRDLQAVMLKKYSKWWQKYIIGETPPEPENYDDIRAMITAPVGTIVVSGKIASWYKEYKDIGKEIGDTGLLSKRRDNLKTLILDEARNQEATLDDESTDKWVFRDDRGNKLGSYSKNKKGAMVFR